VASKLDDSFVASVATRLITEKTRDRIVGMFHSHPDIGIFLSQQDVQTLANFQRLYPRFVMMVIDPLKLQKFEFFTYDEETRLARPLAVQLIE
jgi:proteasome lid subunit RPN8/RPN11